ncbi:hypothetical protein SUGI_0300660 [Cryptomeria japonica]|uniref:uncharacterized protein LOC131074915 isoform X2 n=1 Tax=Cryptomeria japonica TaxID=3369 RepID=UPI002408BAA0|nr:uncharacterized protein LOC131074915 isoform X2 [Cryptomeria japonica]GLJ17316.1 hypothetical protein SUGI_0300660 [Cryptomeria japonica]
MEIFRPKIKLKGANKAADIDQSEGTQNQFKGLPIDSDTYAHHGEGFFPVITGGLKRKRAPRAGERKAKDKQPFMFSKVSTMQSVPTGEEDLLDEDDNAGKEGVEEGARMSDQRQVITGRNRVNVEPVEVKSMEPFQQRRRHLKVKVKTSKSQEGSSVPPEKSTSSDNEISPKYMKKHQKSASDNPEKLGNIVLKPARPLDQPTPPRQGRPPNNEMRSSPIHGEMEKLHSNSENQEKNMVPIHQKPRMQSLAFEKGPGDQSEYNEKELKDALTVVKKIMKMDAAEPFNTPVNPVALGIPDYFDIIDTPMDLGTICSALERGEKYRNSREVFKDVQFIWENCYTYNRKGDPILDLMKRVKKNFVKYWTAAGLYYESPKRTAGGQNSGQGDAILSHEHDGLDESEMEHQVRENPDGNKETQTGKTNFITPEQLSLNVSELKDEQVLVEQVAEESGRREEKVCQKAVEEIKVQHYVQESKAEMDILESTLKDPVIKNKGMKVKIKKSIFEYETQENNGSIIEKEDPTSIGTDEESGPKTVDSAKSLQEETPLQDLHPKAKTRRRHGKYQHKDGCLCAVCVARRRRYAREENAHLAKGQAIMVDADMSEKMNEKVIEFPRKLLGNEDGVKLEHVSSANLIAHPGEQGDDQRVESQKHEGRGQDNEEICENEGSGKRTQDNRKKQFPGHKKLEMHLVKVAHQEEEKEPLMQKESLMQLGEEEEQLDEKGSQKQQEEEVQEEEVKDGQTQDEEETQQQEEVDIQQHEVDSGGYHSADYDIPLQYANPSILQMCEALFTRKCYSFCNQPHSLNYEPKKTLSENKILAAMSTFMD